jgi:hypothetical protein
MQGNTTSEMLLYASLVSSSWRFWVVLQKLTEAPCLAHALHRRHATAPIRSHREQGATAEGLRREAAAVPVAVGPRGGKGHDGFKLHVLHSPPREELLPRLALRLA